MLRGKMRIAHGHGQAGVPHDLLPGEDVAPLLHEVTGEGMAKCMGRLALRPFDTEAIQGAAEGVDAAGSELAAALPPVVAD